MEHDNFAAQLEHALKETLHERGQVTVLIAGRTGVGKSTLINSVFQGRFAETGQGRPVTQHTREYRKDGVPLVIIDTRGLELAAFDETMRQLEVDIEKRRRDSDPSHHVHVGWLCVQEDGRRVEDAEVALHAMLSRHMPVLGVITKARSDHGFRADVQRLLPEARNVVRVRALPEELDDGHTLAPMGLTDLIELTIQVIPDGQRRAFVAAQKASIDHKKRAAHGVVVASAAAAAAAAASPIPFSDALILVPIQVGMLASITAVFGLPLSTGFLATLVATAAGVSGATLAGRTLVANLLKFIPGVGTLAGGAISATTAATFTAMLGEVYIATLAHLMGRSGGEPPSTDDVAGEFRARLGRRP